MTNKKQRTLEHSELFLSDLPSAQMYETSLMHRDIVNYVTCGKSDFIITTSIDGHVKFWKKQQKGIEFVKHYRAHLSVIVSCDLSFDGQLFATASVDKGLKVFDVVNFDMINMFKLQHIPNAVVWAYMRGQSQAILLCSEKRSSSIHVYDGRGGTSLRVINGLHHSPVHLMRFHVSSGTVASIDESGMMEYWQPDLFEDSQGFTVPSKPTVGFDLKSQTDMYEFKKCKIVPKSLSISPDGSKFATFTLEDRKVRIFNFLTAKIIRMYDESLQTISEMQQAGTAFRVLEDMEFGRRLALDRELGAEPGGQAATSNVVFDESGNFILYATLLGIKVVNIKTNKVVRILASAENTRFLNLALYQGKPIKKNVVTIEMAASENPVFLESEQTDPTLFCTAYKKNRFYLVTKREPDMKASTMRDIYNERPTKEDQTVAPVIRAAPGVPTTATIHTTFGDIYIQLFPEYAPLAVKNFIELAKSDYYHNVIFHRVIKGFMIQTGDPNGDGTGGVSHYGYEFQDEFHKDLRHDKPYTVSMANGGPNTNQSQFFITTAPTPWLDDKHTIFARVTGGTDVVQRIEVAKVDRRHKPEDPIRIISVEIR